MTAKEAGLVVHANGRSMQQVFVDPPAKARTRLGATLKNEIDETAFIHGLKTTISTTFS